jgi:hypothetical protein
MIVIVVDHQRDFDGRQLTQVPRRACARDVEDRRGGPFSHELGEVRSETASPAHEDAPRYAATGRRSRLATVSVQALATSRPLTWKCS